MSPEYIQANPSKRFFKASSVHRVKKEWGEEQWIVNKEYCGKKLLLKKNRRCSLHSHKEKDEVFYLQSGKVRMEIGTETFILSPGDFVHIPNNTDHRFAGLEDSEIIEFSTHHEEDDSFRKEFSGHIDPQRFQRQKKLLDEFQKLSVLVIGDVMLDRYVSGSVNRVSPEAPIPVVQVEKEWDVPGGAGNAAANVRALGAKVHLVSVTGRDSGVLHLKRLCKERQIELHILEDRSRPTIQKERIVDAQGRQIVRIDTERTMNVSKDLQKKIETLCKKLMLTCDAVLVSDYAKGVITPQLLETIIQTAIKRKIPVIVDPKPRSGLTVKHLEGATLLTPNAKEARALFGDDTANVLEAGKMITKKTGADMLLTRGEEGMDVWSKGTHVTHFDSKSPAVVDVSGAGDTVAAVAALTLAAGGSITDAADLGTCAAGIVVGKQGTATVTREELEQAL